MSTPTPAPKPSAFTQLTGTITPANAAAKPPTTGSAIVALFNGQVQSLDSSAPGTLWRTSTAPPATPGGICGDSNNGVAIFSGSKVSYLTGVGVSKATWYSLPELKDATGHPVAIEGISGDLVNGLVVFSGKNVYSFSFTSTPTPPEWVLMSAAPFPVTGIAGDPSTGILLAVNTGSGPSSLYFTQGDCMCMWAPVTGGSLPVAKVMIERLCGNVTNGFIFYGENQLFSLKVTPATAPALTTGAQTKLPVVPFPVRAISGDGKNGIFVIGGTGDLVASSSDSSGTTWAVVAVKEASPAPTTALAVTAVAETEPA